LDIDINVMPDLTNLLMQLISTAILLIVVRHFAWAPMQAFLKARSELVTKEITAAEEAKALAEELKTAAESEIVTARNQAKTIVANSEQQAQKVRESILEDASLEAKRKLDKAALEIELERKKLYANVQKDIVDLAIASAENLIEKEIDSKNHEQLFNKFLKKVGGSHE